MFLFLSPTYPPLPSASHLTVILLGQAERRHCRFHNVGKPILFVFSGIWETERRKGTRKATALGIHVPFITARSEATTLLALDYMLGNVTAPRGNLLCSAVAVPTARQISIGQFCFHTYHSQSNLINLWPGLCRFLRVRNTERVYDPDI